MGIVPREAWDWICQQESCPASLAASRVALIEKSIVDAVRRTLGRMTARVVPEDGARFEPYLRRWWTCVEYHWRNAATVSRSSYSVLASQLETFETSGAKLRANLLRDVVLAEALEQCEPRAAELFEQEYAAMIRATAQRVGGPRSAEAVENFAAQLILAEPGKASKLSKYQGRTALGLWLKTVVMNYCRSQFRSAHAKTASLQVEPMASSLPAEVDAATDHHECHDLLRPIFRSALATVDTADRVLVKMLVLDGVPQKELAGSLGIHTGNLGRRRDRAAAQIFQAIRAAVMQNAEHRRADECLELVVAGDNLALRQALGEILLEGFEGHSRGGTAP